MTQSLPSDTAYEPVMGLEVHAELATDAKMFCGCSTRFGAPSNSQTCPVCLGLPGSLPVVNHKAVDYGLRAALALGCEILNPCLFERKNYYYPDLPKNYQISQKRRPLGRSGRLEIEVEGSSKLVGIDDVHLEEDTGKLLHPEGAGNHYSLVDYNRSGVPLLEIVGAPDLRSLKEVSAYMTAIRDLLLCLGVSDCRMEEGKLRFEANISLRPAGAEEYGARVEIKNLNSFRTVLRCLEHEIERQQQALRAGAEVARETRLWNEAACASAAMRSKEEAQDYRYFPEPDLVPLMIDARWLERARAALPELPGARRRRFVVELGLSPYDAGILAGQREVADYFEGVVAAGVEAKAAANWVAGELLRHLNERGVAVAAAPVTPERLAELIKLVEQGGVTTKAAKEVFAEMFASGRAAAEIVAERGLGQIRGQDELAAVVERVIADNPAAAGDLRGGKEQALKFLVGQVMKATRGRADAQAVGALLRRRLE
ncbi:MAG TPA: Asp-tRNA(Asn)/Glu-tRNA(Gln) amidotransferase subunit GatB [Armatimonadota bacterium]|nr:Asp-tRNA(Asn)/Glu-tRNA(Gln) amidotransferase subunit GatB [Armatimonadota bacterium]